MAGGGEEDYVRAGSMKMGGRVEKREEGYGEEKERD